MNRREFLKGAGAFVVLCATGWRTLSARPGKAEAMPVEAAPAPGHTVETAVGPLLVTGLTAERTATGATILYQGETMFTVNDMGMRLLEQADGTHTLDAIIDAADAAPVSADAARFFVTLGQAGYLQNRVEVMLYEA